MQTIDGDVSVTKGGSGAKGTTPSTISSAMSVSEIIAVLRNHRCHDITGRLDLDKCGRRPISGGGFGDVYQGTFKEGMRIAIKCARIYVSQEDEDARKVLKACIPISDIQTLRVARELYIWSRFEHENVLGLLGLAQFRDQVAMISPWMDNGTLLHYISRYPAVDRYQLCVDVSSGVAYLHQNDVTHGDIKSANVLVSSEGVAKLADFGCTQVRVSTIHFTTTTSGSNFSTRWAAPEVIAGEATSTKEADVYALGMTLLEAVTGMVPFSEKTDIAVSYAVAVKQQMPERPKEFPSFTSDEANWLWEIMVESYAYSSSARPGSSAIHNRLQNLRQYTKELPLESATNNIGTGIDEFEVEAQPHLFAYDGDETTAGFFASGPTNSGEIIQTPPRPIEREPRAMDFDVDEHQAFTPSTESVRTLQAPLAPQLQMKSESPTPSDELEPPADSATTEVDRLSKEADKLAQQFDAYGNLDDLNNAIEVYGKVAELLAPSPETLDVSSYLNLGRMMRIKFEAFYNIEDLDSAVDDALLKAYESLAYSPTHESYCDVLHELAAASLDRYLYDGSERAGDDAQRYCKRALNAPHALSGPKRAAIHITFSRLHLTRFEYFSTAEDPIRAMYSLDHASEADPTLTDDARYMENRARWLYTCYQTGQPEFASFLGEALELAHAARNSTPPETIQFPIASTFLAELLLARYEKSGGQTDLTEALELLEAAIQDVPYICPEQPWVGERLAWALVAKFTDERDREDLDDAIWFLETAVNLTVTNPYRRQARLDRLGGALTLRFRHLALGEELDVNRVAETRDLMAGIGSM